MEKECSFVRDVLPLYFENMVSDDTAGFVGEHLENCPECAAEFEKMRSGKELDVATSSHRENDAKVIMAMKKKIRKRKWIAVSVIVACLVLIATALHFFPIYRIVEMGALSGYYTGEEIGKALYIGSASDRREAQAVLRLADKAFNDTRHTRAENEEAYGLLARYATATDSYGDTAFNEHFLELWSAHLGENEGWIWVYYSSQTFSHDGSTACGSWHIPSLWKVEKNENGEWAVVQIREHP